MGSDERKEQLPGSFCFELENIQLALQIPGTGLVDHIFVDAVLDFAQSDGIVLTVKEQIDLHSSFFAPL
jgi:hypothetical protein